MCMFVCECGLDFVKPALLTRSENPTKTLLFGLIVSPVSGICQSSGNTQMRVHPRSHTHAQTVAFGQSRVVVSGSSGGDGRGVH